MYPKLKLNGVDTVAILNNIKTNMYTRRINNKYIFTFNCFEEKFKTENLGIDNYLVVLGENQDQYFDVNYIKNKHQNSGEILYTVQTEHISYRLIGDEDSKIDRYAFTGTPTEIMNDLLGATDFTVGIVDYTDSVIFAVNREATILEILFELANTLGGQIDFRAFTIDLRDSIGQNNSYTIRIKKNLKEIEKIIDKRGDLRVSYVVQLVNIFKSEELKSRGLEDLEQVNIGDTIRVIDETLNIDVETTVLELSKDVIDDRNLVVTLTNSLDLLNDKIYLNNVDSVKKTERIYGININNDVGFQVERTDKRARSIFNADEFRMQTGNGSGSYTDAVYFDPVDGKYKFTGDVEVSGIITGAEIIGSSINNGNGTFLVDVSGNVTANSLTIGGGSGVANLSDSGNLATKDAVDFNVVGEILNAGALAVKDAVDLATTEVLNKSADNISESGTRKWAAESGADVTGNNTALNIIDQGLLAVLDSINGTYIDENSITTPLIAAGAVVTSKIGAGAVTANEINVGALSAISADLGTVTAGTINGLDVFANQFTAENTVTVNTNNVNEGFILDAPVDMYVKVNDPSGTLDVGPSVNIPGSLLVAGTFLSPGIHTINGEDILTEATGCVNISSQRMGFQVVGGALEVFIGGVYQFTLTP